MDEVASLTQDVENALKSRLDANADHTLFHNLLKTLTSGKPDNRVKIYNALSHCASAVVHCREVLACVSAFSWSSDTDAAASAFGDFLVSLASAEKTMIKPIVFDLIGRFLVRRMPVLNQTDVKQTEFIFDIDSNKNASRRLHPVVRQIIALVPMSTSICADALLHHFPHRMDSPIVQSTFLHNALQVAANCPILMETVLDLAIHRLIELDAENSSMRTNQSLIQLIHDSIGMADGYDMNANEEREREHELQFDFDAGAGTSTSNMTGGSKKSPSMGLDNADESTEPQSDEEELLDTLLDVLFEFIDGLLGQVPSDSEIAHSFHGALLQTLFAHVLPQKGVEHVPYLWLFAATRSTPFRIVLVHSLCQRIRQECDLFSQTLMSERDAVVAAAATFAATHSAAASPAPSRGTDSFLFPSPAVTPNSRSFTPTQSPMTRASKHNLQLKRSRLIIERCASFTAALATRAQCLSLEQVISVFSTLADAASLFVNLQSIREDILDHTGQSSRGTSPHSSPSFSSIAPDPTLSVLVQLVCCGIILPQTRERLLAALEQDDDLLSHLHLHALLSGRCSSASSSGSHTICLPVVMPDVAACIVHLMPDALRDSGRRLLKTASKHFSSSGAANATSPMADAQMKRVLFHSTPSISSNASPLATGSCTPLSTYSSSATVSKNSLMTPTTSIRSRGSLTENAPNLALMQTLAAISNSANWFHFGRYRLKRSQSYVSTLCLVPGSGNNIIPELEDDDGTESYDGVTTAGSAPSSAGGGSLVRSHLLPHYQERQRTSQALFFQEEQAVSVGDDRSTDDGSSSMVGTPDLVSVEPHAALFPAQHSFSHENVHQQQQQSSIISHDPFLFTNPTTVLYQ